MESIGGGDLQGSACQKKQPLTDKYHDVGGLNIKIPKFLEKTSWVDMGGRFASHLHFILFLLEKQQKTPEISTGLNLEI